MTHTTVKHRVRRPALIVRCVVINIIIITIVFYFLRLVQIQITSAALPTTSVFIQTSSVTGIPSALGRRMRTLSCVTRRSSGTRLRTFTSARASCIPTWLSLQGGATSWLNVSTVLMRRIARTKYPTSSAPSFVHLWRSSLHCVRSGDFLSLLKVVFDLINFG